jgi:hypothetical protein
VSIKSRSQDELELLPIPVVAKNTLSKILDLFADQGHSGFSAGYLIPRVIAFANLTSDEIEDLMYCKEKDCDEDEDEMQRMITDNVKELVAELEPLKGPYFHFYLDILKKLMHQDPVTPITFEDDQWVDVGAFFGYGEAGNYFQHKRASNVFKNNGVIYQSDYFSFDNNILNEDCSYTCKLSQKNIDSESWVPIYVKINYDFVKEVYDKFNEEITRQMVSEIKALREEIKELHANKVLNKTPVNYRMDTCEPLADYPKTPPGCQG